MTARSCREEVATGASSTPPRAEVPGWRRDFGVVAGITLRAGASDPEFGLASSRPAAEVVEAWTQLGAAFRPGFESVVVSRQTHGSRVRIHDRVPQGWLVLDGYDGHATGAAGVLLAVTVADCVPVYLVHPPSESVALLHAGWRGIAAGVLEEGLEALRQVAGVAGAEDIAMHAGVAISGDRYEVGPEVLAGLGLRPAGEGARFHVDLRQVLADRAARAGVGRVTVSEWCTHRDAARFHSHRRAAAAAGRMVAYLGRPLT